jgi:hypothetical protein
MVVFLLPKYYARECSRHEIKFAAFLSLVLGGDDWSLKWLLYYTCTHSETLPTKSATFLVHEDNQEGRKTFSHDGTGIYKAHWISTLF